MQGGNELCCEVKHAQEKGLTLGLTAQANIQSSNEAHWQKRVVVSAMNSEMALLSKTVLLLLGKKLKSPEKKEPTLSFPEQSVRQVPSEWHECSQVGWGLWA